MPLMDLCKFAIIKCPLCTLNTVNLAGAEAVGCVARGKSCVSFNHNLQTTVDVKKQFPQIYLTICVLSRLSRDWWRILVILPLVRLEHGMGWRLPGLAPQFGRWINIFIVGLQVASRFKPSFILQSVGSNPNGEGMGVFFH